MSITELLNCCAIFHHSTCVYSEVNRGITSAIVRLGINPLERSDPHVLVSAVLFLLRYSQFTHMF
jgi:hypothetical protein